MYGERAKVEERVGTMSISITIQLITRLQLSYGRTRGSTKGSNKIPYIDTYVGLLCNFKKKLMSLL